MYETFHWILDILYGVFFVERILRKILACALVSAVRRRVWGEAVELGQDSYMAGGRVGGLRLLVWWLFKTCVTWTSMATTIQEKVSLGPGSAMGGKGKKRGKIGKMQASGIRGILGRVDRQHQGMSPGSATLSPPQTTFRLASLANCFFSPTPIFSPSFQNAKPGPWLRNVKNCENKTNLVYSLVTLPYRNLKSNLKVQTLFFSRVGRWYCTVTHAPSWTRAALECQSTYLNTNQNAFLRKPEASWHQSLEKRLMNIRAKTSNLQGNEAKWSYLKQGFWRESYVQRVKVCSYSQLLHTAILFILTSPVEAISHFNSGSASRSRGHENIGAWKEDPTS